MKKIIAICFLLVAASNSMADCTGEGCPVRHPIVIETQKTIVPPSVPAFTVKETAPIVMNREITDKKIIHLDHEEPNIPPVNDSSQIGDQEKVKIFDATVTVLPETTTMIHVSNVDVNRVVCPVDMGEDSVIYSKEKHIVVETRGKNAFIKFLIMKTDDKETTVTNPTEFHILCNDNVYSIIAYPKAIPAQTIKLFSKKEKQRNLALISLPYEEKIQQIIQNVYFNKIQGYSITSVNQKISVFKDIDVLLRNIVKIDSEGIIVKEYLVKANNNLKDEVVTMKEKDFIKNEITTQPLAIMLEKFQLRKNDLSRLLVVEKDRESYE